MKKGIIYVIGLFPLLVGVSAFAEDTGEEVTEEIIEEIEVPEYEVSDAINKAEEIIKSIDKSVLPLKTMDLENETENEGTNTGNNYYIVDNDYSQINDRLDQIDNKLSSLSLLGSEDNIIYVSPISDDFPLRINNSGVLTNTSLHKIVYFQLLPNVTYTLKNNYLVTGTANVGAFIDTSLGSSYFEVFFNGFSYSSSRSFSVSSSCLLVISNYGDDVNLNDFTLSYISSDEPDNPENPDSPDNPDEPIVPDSNILDALNSIKAELVKINKYNDTKLYSSEDEFKDAPLYMNKYQYETYKLLKYLVILLTCINGLMLIYIFGGRKRGNT